MKQPSSATSPSRSGKLSRSAACRSGIDARIGARAKSASSIVLRAPIRWTSMPLGIPRIAIGAISAARTRLIFPGEPVVTSTNQGSARYVIRVPRTETTSAATSADTAFFTPVAAALTRRRDIKRPYGFVKYDVAMPKISEERKAERREQILAGARRCFAEHGYEGATVARLEREIGLSRGAIFNYFPSKEELFVELAVPRQRADRPSSGSNEGLEAVAARDRRARPGLARRLPRAHRGASAPTRTSARGIEERRTSRSPPVEPARRIEEAQRAGELRDDLDARGDRRASSTSSLNGLALQRAPARRAERRRRSSSSLGAASRTLSETELVAVRRRVHVPEALRPPRRRPASRGTRSRSRRASQPSTFPWPAW